jgi:hypothetical protein
MGILDDAIREHLELKRSKGATDDELQEKEAEAFGRGAAAPARPAPDDPSPVAEPPAAESPTPPAWESESAQDDLLDPDEVLPEESRESIGTRPPLDEVVLRTEEITLDDPDSLDVREDDEPPERWESEIETETEPSEDLLEETPDFLEETPEHDRLWFEQKPPKDFDFD